MKCCLCGVTENKDGTPIKYRICKTCNNKKAKQYYLENSEKLKKRSNLWKKRNREKVIEISKRYRAELKIQALKAYNNNEKPKCVCCGETEIDFLCLDHINNIRRKEREKYGLGTSFLKWLKTNNYPKHLGLQVLCFNCNFSKRIHGVCIHQLRK
ncbi:MAG: hypothetical protein ISS83_02950 [Candidatus Pacebacteria bacterium]|nr:hypothetical protein [Candidatus Paceibacterota bacterium]